MISSRKVKLYLFPIILLWVPAILGLYWDLYHRHYRGLGTPFLYPSIGLILISLFFWAGRRWMYFVLIGATGVYLFFFFRNALWKEDYPPSVVYYYRHWSLDTTTGLLQLEDPMGPHPPKSGSYISCNFTLKRWTDFLKKQPTLCTAFDDQLRLQMTLNDGEGPQGPIREFQMNYFNVERKSLLGEPLDRWALRIAFQPIGGSLFSAYRVKAIYQVFERELAPGKNKIVESFSRNSKGLLKSFTESPMLKFTQQDVYALYGPDGGLVEIPRRGHRSFSFPAKIDVSRYEVYHLPEIVGSKGSS